MKKVGLVTYYGDNYGGVLQAYALQRVVKANGFDCELISNEFLSKRTRTKRISAILRNLACLIKQPRSYLKKRKIYHSYLEHIAAKARKFKEFRQDNLDIYETGYDSYDEYLSDPPKYDVYLCGSDQIWNPNLYNKNGFYFAGFASDDALKLSYASSIGVSTVNKKQANFMAPLLNRLDVISTREQKGAEIINAISGKVARVVLDPTFLLDGDEWSKIAAPRIIEEPYIFCYLFGERKYVADVKEKVKKLTNMKVVSIPFVPRELSSDDMKVFEAGPMEFISLIKNASLVLTDSFHATAFSINFKTPFISLCRFEKSNKKSMNDRLVTILEMVGLSNRLVDENDSIFEEFLYDVDFEKAHARLEEQRQKDLQFLLDSLNCNKMNL